MARQDALPLFNFLVDLPDAELTRCAAAPSLADLLEAEPDFLARISSKGDLCWCLQTYLILKQRGSLPVALSSRPLSGAVNIVHSDHLLTLRGNSELFLLCVRADFPRRPWAQYHIVQNQAQRRLNSAYVPLWPQPFLVGRNPEREGVRRIAYAGEIVNGNLAGGVEGWRTLFAQHGIEFVQPQSNAWHDLSAIDVMIGVRSFDRRPHDSKPPSKLINAWLAGIPFVGGYDSAFSQIGKPGEDYLWAKSQEEVVEAVLQLRDSPLLYSLLVRNGARKVEDFTLEALAERWETLLLGAVLRRWQRWQAFRRYERARFRLALALGLAEHNGKQLIKKVIRRKRNVTRHRLPASTAMEGPPHGGL